MPAGRPGQGQAFPMPGRAARIAGMVLTGLLVLCLTAMLLLASAQILWRNAFSMAIPYSGDLLEWLVLWIAMLGAMGASAGSRHISIDALSHLLSDEARRWAGVAVQFFAMSACVALLLITGAYWLDTMGYGETTLGGVPRWILETILPAAFAVMAGAHFCHMVSFVRRGRLAASKEPGLPARGA